MSTNEAVVKVVTILCEAYPAWGQKVTKQTYDVWARLLGDVPPAELVRAAVQHTQTSSFPPTVADLRRLAQPERMRSGDEAFELARKAAALASRYDERRCAEALKALEAKDPVAAEALHAFGGFAAFWDMLTTDIPTHRAQFRAIYDAALKRTSHERGVVTAKAALAGGPRRMLDVGVPWGTIQP